jgi:hypothetical protein
MSLPYTWYPVQYYNNTFKVDNNILTIPSGSYNVLALRNALREKMILIDPTARVDYDSLTGKFTFIFSSQRTIDPLNMYDFFGFDKGEKPSGNVIVSSKPVKVTGESFLIVKSTLQTDGMSLDNFEGFEFTSSDVLTHVNINAQPFSTINFSPYNNNVTRVIGKSIESLSIKIETADGFQIDFLHDYLIVLRINFKKPHVEDQVQLLEEIKELIRLDFLSKQIKS